MVKLSPAEPVSALATEGPVVPRMSDPDMMLTGNGTSAIGTDPVLRRPISTLNSGSARTESAGTCGARSCAARETEEETETLRRKAIAPATVPNERKAVKEINCILDPPVNMVEQDVDHESSNRHIEPGGVDPTGQASVVLEALRMGQIEES